MPAFGTVRPFLPNLTSDKWSHMTCKITWPLKVTFYWPRIAPTKFDQIFDWIWPDKTSTLWSDDPKVTWPLVDHAPLPKNDTCLLCGQLHHFCQIWPLTPEVTWPVRSSDPLRSLSTDQGLLPPSLVKYLIEFGLIWPLTFVVKWPQGHLTPCRSCPIT